ncbi:MAG: 30S ribosomal protein S12 methylthiotransferase RimO [Acidobacteriota bacterium]|nr:MAG: 30S ribosomal protein S12 methylthiotransferase RimO [Acidobacteriota bacterium]
MISAADRDPQNARERRRAALVSLGCPKNQVDSELMLGRLAAEGVEIVDDPELADTLIINTCGFIDRARAESVEALLEAAAWKSAHPGRRVIAAGCLVQRSAAELAEELPELDAFVGLDQIDAITAFLPTRAGRTSRTSSMKRPLPVAGPARKLYGATQPRRRLSPPWTAYVKIAEGCDQSCAFCAIPTFRGRQRSRPVEDVLDELRRLASEGVVEANLIAQDSTGFGRDRGERDGLAELLEAIDSLDDGPAWVRVHYLYPGRISRRLLDVLRGARRVVEYIDLPLQHADAEILRRMRRPGDAQSYLEPLEQLREALPGAGVRSGFIVGFPGETDAHFAALARFVERAALDAAGVFTYSHEQATAALAYQDDVPAEVKRERQSALEEILAAVAHVRNEARVGSVLEVLTEGPAETAPTLISARWRGQAPEVDGRVLIAGADHLPAGRLVRVRIERAEPFELVGRLAGEVESVREPGDGPDDPSTLVARA